MSSIDDEFRTFIVHVRAVTKEIFDGVVEETRRSIVEGSEITGSPGQPVGQYGPGYHNGKLGGTLKASWETQEVSDFVAVISTDAEYAPYIEDGGNSRGEFQLRSSVGGFHSVKQTLVGMPRIVDAVVARVVPGGG